MLAALPSDAVPTPMGIPVTTGPPKPGPAQPPTPQPPTPQPPSQQPQSPQHPTPRPPASQPTTPQPSSAFAHPATGIRGISPVHIQQDSGRAGKAGSRPKWLVPVIVAVALLVGTMIALGTLLNSEDDYRTDPGSYDERYQESVSGTAKAVELTPTVAGNFVLGWLRSAKTETQSSWDKMDPASRPSYDEYAKDMGQYDEIVPSANPEVAAKGDDYLVTGTVTLTQGGRSNVKDYQVLVKMVDGQLKIAEYHG